MVSCSNLRYDAGFIFIPSVLVSAKWSVVCVVVFLAALNVVIDDDD